MKKLILALALVSSSLSAAPWTDDPYLDRVRDLDNAALEKLAADRDLPATVQLARNLWENREAERAVALMRIAAEADVPTAQFHLGGWLWLCFSTDCDQAGGLALMERAAQAGHPLAHEILGDLYKRDSKIFKKNLAKSYAHYLAAAQLGLISSQAEVAGRLCEGIGVKKDRKAGRKWLDLAQKDQLAKFSYKEAGC